MTVIHGGDWAGYKFAHGEMPLDFSANTSPLGIPKGVKSAITDALTYADRYPDPLCRELRKCIGEKIDLPEENILCGNGAADIIFRLALAKKPKNALITAPTFGEYKSALETAGCAVSEYMLKEENDFQIEEDILSRITPETDMLFLCEPNNPTGKTTDKNLLGRIIEKCVECKALLVVDECFNDFLDVPEEHTVLKNIANKNIFVLKAFTKFYGMAGVRLGYCLSTDSALLEKMRECGQPWGVSTLAQAAGIAALKETDYETTLRKTVFEGRQYLIKELKNLELKVFDGEANYLLFKTDDLLLGEKIAEKGILIRDCSNYSGLEKGWYRIAVRGTEDNKRLIYAIKEVQNDKVY